MTISERVEAGRREAASRRPAREWDIPGVEPPEPTRLGEVAWLEPFPDALLAGGIGVPPGPEAVYEQAESISTTACSHGSGYRDRC